MKRFLFISVALLAVAVGVGYFYYTDKIEDKLDELAATMRPFGELNHGEATITWDGAVYVDGLRFEPRAGGNSFRVSRVTLRAENLWALWNMGDELEAKRIPREMGISIKGLEMPIAGSVATSERTGGVTADFSAAGCGNRRSFSVADLAAMGYDRVSADIDLDYHLLGDVEGFRLNYRVRVADIAQINAGASLRFRAPSRRIQVLTGAATQARLDSAELHYRDLGYVQKVLALCTEETGLSREAYIARHLRAWKKRWAKAGFEAGPNLVTTYSGLAKGAGEVSVKLSPTPPVSVVQLASMPMLSILRSVDASLYRDGNAVGTLDLRPLSAEERAEVAAARQKGETRSGPTDDAAGDAASAPEVSERAANPGPRRVGPGALEDYVGRQAVVVMSDGRTLEGRLEAIENEQVRLRQRLSGGYAVVPVAKGKIAEVQITP